MPANQLPDWIRNFQPDELWNLAAAFNWSRDDLPMLIAEVDHKRWIRALHAYLDDTTGTAEPPPLGEHACRFSRWQDSPDSKRYMAIEAFHAIPALHARMHEIGARLVAQHQAGNRTAITALRNELQHINEQLSEALQSIQTEVLMSNQRIRL